jgi:membrane-bound serine protease (ClpP class)
MAGQESRHSLDHLLGQCGRCLTPLHPCGLVDFEGRRLDALSEDGLIETGALVQAVQIRGRQLVVRNASAEALARFDAVETQVPAGEWAGGFGSNLPERT